jgi:hypothetical protein
MTRVRLNVYTKTNGSYKFIVGKSVADSVMDAFSQGVGSRLAFSGILDTADAFSASICLDMSDIEGVEIIEIKGL